jgi:23S rRNA pseudouridine1911/1915/1917 synthase
MKMAASSVLNTGTADAIQAFRRQALHAYLLGFRHPRSAEPVRWVTELPNDMNDLMNFLEGN